MPHLSHVQIAALAITLIIGFLFGFIANNSGRKWRRRFRDEQRYYAEYRDKTDALNLEKTKRIAELEAQAMRISTEDSPLADDAAAQPDTPPVEAHAAEPIAESEAVAAGEATALADMVPADAPADESGEVAASDGPEIEAVAEPAVEPAAEAEPAVMELSQDGTIAPAAPEPSDATSDLTKIRGVDAGLAAALAAEGIANIEAIERLSAEQEIAIEEKLGLQPGHIAREQWRLQAALIGSGEEAAHHGGHEGAHGETREPAHQD